MKNNFLKIWIAVMTIFALLLGCAPAVDTSATDPAGSPTVIQTEPVPTEAPVDEEVFYFSNELEYNRLYRMRYDGTDLKLVLDDSCYDARQEGDRVFYLNGTDLCVFEISKGESRILVEDVIDYAVDGDDLVYYQDSKEVFMSQMRYRNLESGEDYFIESHIMAGGCDVADGILYYSRYDQETGNGQLCVCDLETMEINAIASELTSFYRLQAVSDGVYFEAIGEDYTFGQYYASADGGVVCKVEADLTDFCQVFHVADGKVFCVHSIYDEMGQKSSIHCHNSDGSITEILRGENEGYYTVSALDEGRWLVKYNCYAGWGQQNEYGVNENYAFRSEHFLLDADGTIIPLDVTGELGKMFADGDFPVIDSSTARKPVTAAMYSLFVANYGYEGAQPLCSTTHGAWLNIADRKADIALLAAPTEEELAYLAERGVEIEMKLYGGDGLVFIGNAANPVNDLTHEQIIAIYRGEITNWSQVGGPDHPITVYYRDDQSGSQRLFEKLVFKGVEIPDFYDLGFDIMDEMSTIVDIVLSDPYAIGYSIMTYLDEVYAQEELKGFAVNGVVPSPDTVKNATYPYHTQGYVVIRSDEPANSPARRLYNWFGSAACNDLLNDCSVTPLQDGVG